MELGGDIPSGCVQFGGEYEHGQTGPESEVAVDEADADCDRDERDADRRRQLEHRAGEEGDSKRPHRRRPVALADGPATCSDCASPRLNARRVGSPRTTSAKCEASSRERLPTFLCPGWVWRPTSHMNTGTSGEREQHDPSRGEVDRRHEREDGDGDYRRQHHLREVTRERGLEGIHAGDGDGRELGAARTVGSGRLPRQPLRHELEPETREHATRCEPANGNETPRCERARADDGDEQDERRRDLGERCAVERAGGYSASSTAWARTSSAATRAKKRVDGDRHACLSRPTRGVVGRRPPRRSR